MPEAALAQLELDRLEQVVRLVRDLEIGVAGDPEDAALDDLHLREQRRQEVAQDTLQRQERPALADRREPRQSSGTLTRAKRSSPDFGSRTNTPRLSESPEMYGNGWPAPTASGVSTG